MIKQIMKRLVSMTLVVMMILSVMPSVSLTAYAATNLSDLTVDGLTAQYDGGTWSSSGTGITGSATGSSGCGDSAGSGALTLTNSRTEEALLSFDYSLTLNGGSITIDGTSVTEDGHFEKNVESEDVVSISITTQSGSYTSSISISNISLVVEKEVTTTFKPAENGSFTVDGETISSDVSYTQLSTKAYSLEATPASGYKFLSWYSETTGSYLGSNASTTLLLESDQSITALFVSDTLPTFETAGSRFADLNEAVAYAQAKDSNKITLVEDGILPEGDYIIPSGITLLIPFDEAGTMYTTTPASTRSYTKPTAFRTLTMEDGAHITVNGGISISAQHFAAGGSQNGGGSPSGKVGFVQMQGNSSITVNSGGALYAWGFITGSGAVEILSGGTAYEYFQIADFRGGSATSALSSGPIFPFSQYYVQNVEVPMTIHGGAKEIVYSSLYAGGMSASTSIEFIGTDGMFNLNDGSTLTKTYDGTRDRLIFDLNGDAELKNMTVKVYVTVDSANFNLPINSNITLNINSGTTTIKQDVDLLPGVEANIASGASLNIASGKKVHVYDSEQWDNYTLSSKFISVLYAPSKTYTRTEANDIKDVVVDVNGNIEINGALYTTESGADVTSSGGTGQIVFNVAAGTETTTQQYQNNSTKVTIPITAAKLHNADDTYTETTDAVAEDVYTYVNGTWTKNADAEPETETVNVNFDANEGTGTMNAQSVTKNEETTLNANIFTREGYDFTGWNTAADGSGTAYADGASVTLTEDTTLFAQWQVKTFTVTWVDEDGTVLETDENVGYGEIPEYNGANLVKENTEQYSYEFVGWTPELTPVTADVIYKATYSESVNTYNVTWKNEDGTVLDTELVAYGKTPVYSGETPSKEATAQNTYEFAGWTPEVTVVTGNAEYTAVYTSIINRYTVIWKNWDGEVLETDENVEYGLTPEYNGELPVHEGNDQYSYEFIGWTPELNSVTGSIEYTATFSETVNEYIVTWKNGDEVIKTESVAYGEMPVYSGETPTKEFTEQYSYEFAGWTPELSEVTGNVTYTAEFNEYNRYYRIYFACVDTDDWENFGDVLYDKEGNPLSLNYIENGHVLYGEMPFYTNLFDPADFFQPNNAKYTYKFDHWMPELTAVRGDATYLAVFSATINTYTVTWEDEDGSVLKTEKLEYGTTPVYDGTPTKASDGNYNYTFAGWSSDITEVTEDTTYTATYKATEIIKYTVIFDANGGDGIMDPQVFTQGVDSSLNENAFTRDNYTFIGWNTEADGSGATYAENGAIIDLDADMTLYAQWRHDDGWFEDEIGKQYYSDGILQTTGWTTIDSKTYYLDEETGYAVANGAFWLPYPEGYGPDESDLENHPEYVEAGYDTCSYFVFDEEGVFESGYTGTYTLEDGTLRWVADGELSWHGRLVTDGEGYYYVSAGGNLKKNVTDWIGDTNDLLPSGTYVFGSDGKIVMYDGFVTLDGTLCYFVNGRKDAVKGLFEVNGDYYYMTSKLTLVCDSDYYVSNTNDLMPAGTYHFDKNGKMVIDEDETKNGLYEENGSLYYYVDGVKTHAGLVEIDGAYYYINSACKAVCDCDYYVSNPNGLMAKGYYHFDADGKMVIEDTSSKNGLYEENGSLYYYVDGVKTHAGLVEIDGAYYYINSACKAVCDCDYYVSNPNGLMAKGYYHFDADGKMVIEDTSSKNGLYEENGSLYYYVDGVKTHAGLVEIDGAYYYINSACKAVCDCDYYVSNPNGLIAKGYYHFDADGKMSR